MKTTLKEREMGQAQAALLLAIILQISLDRDLVIGPQFTIAILELLLVFGIGLTAPLRHDLSFRLRRTFALALIALISFVNFASMVLVVNNLIHGATQGKQIIFSAFAIYVTNIIIFSLWYWELDRPGLSGINWKKDRRFLFPQQMESAPGSEKEWEPSYFDYLYLSITNSTALSPTDAMPMTHGAKAIMGLQALIALITIVLVTARAVTTLG
jgi:hypothetical protein